MPSAQFVRLIWPKSLVEARCESETAKNRNESACSGLSVNEKELNPSTVSSFSFPRGWLGGSEAQLQQAVLTGPF